MEITADQYRKTLLVFQDNLKGCKDNLNKINVFPVRDADTGSNMYQTFKGINNGIKHTKVKHFGLFSEKVAECALKSAVGNVGNIMALFFYGVANYSREKEVLHNLTK